MPSYVVNPADPTTPTNTQGATQGAEEFRALKAYINGLAGLNSGASFLQQNLLINPNWQIDQINEGALYTVAAATVKGPDGWSGIATGAGTFRLRTLTDPDNAAKKCLEITCTVADAAIAAADQYVLFTAIEGFDCAGLQFGLASAQSVSIKFKFKTNLIGVYGLVLQNSAGDRNYISAINVLNVNENEYTFTIAGDQAGTWLKDAGIGLKLGIVLAAGTDFQGAAGAWQAGNLWTTSSQVNFMSVNTNIAYLKEISLVAGNVVLPYNRHDYQADIQKCQRYYWKSFKKGTAVAQNVGANTGEIIFTAPLAGAVTEYSPSYTFPVNMRSATPTITLYNPANGNAQVRDQTAGADCAASAMQRVSDAAFSISCTGNAGTTAGGFLGFHATADARLS